VSPAKKIQDWPQRVERCAHEAKAWTAMRDEAIRQMSKEGASLRTVATAAGLTHAAVARILKRG
jgi:uridine phosphorylase